MQIECANTIRVLNGHTSMWDLTAVTVLVTSTSVGFERQQLYSTTYSFRPMWNQKHKMKPHLASPATTVVLGAFDRPLMQQALGTRSTSAKAPKQVQWASEG